MTPNLPFLGHENLYRQLEQRKTSARLPHALLFTGPEGVGKRIVALHLAKSLLCHRTEGFCGTCPTCTLGNFQDHPDFSLIEPDNGRIKIETMREIKRSLAFPPLLGARRVVLINDAHCMNAAAANALLKTLEEPPGETYFILITHALGWLPRTIVSRCQKIRFSPLSRDLLEKIFVIARSPAKRDDEAISPGLPRPSGPRNDKDVQKYLAWSQGSLARAKQLMEVEDKIPPLQKLFPSPHSLTFGEAFELSQRVVEEEKVIPFLEALYAEAHSILTQPEDSALSSRGEPLNFSPETWANRPSHEKADKAFGSGEKFKGSPRDSRFDLLVFADRITEIRRSLRLNANPKIHLARLLMFFQEPLESRL